MTCGMMSGSTHRGCGGVVDVDAKPAVAGCAACTFVKPSSASVWCMGVLYILNEEGCNATRTIKEVVVCSATHNDQLMGAEQKSKR